VSHIGEIAAMGTAVMWTVGSIAFADASRRSGSFAINLLRLLLVCVLFALVGILFLDGPLPINAGKERWIWLSASGIVGFLFGDYCLFKSFSIIGPRITQLVMGCAPIIAAVSAFILLGEKLTLIECAGMCITLSGISIVAFGRDETGRGVSLRFPRRGLLYAFGGATGQGLGITLSKIGMHGLNPFAATQIRALAGFVGFALLAFIFKKWKNAARAAKDHRAMRSMIIGTLFGPFFGVSCALFALSRAPTGVVSTILALVPVLIIIPAYFILREKITIRDIVGALISFTGIALFMI
jgi:drug/metabolite transporter (DMT)-like permease